MKRRRLDELLNKKFEAVNGAGGSGEVLEVAASNERGKAGDTALSADPITNSQMRRSSTSPSRTTHRRKQARPSNPNSPASIVSKSSPLRSGSSSPPPALSIRPHADLFPPMMATSSPNKASRLSASPAPPPAVRESSPAPSSSPFPRPQSPPKDDNDNKTILKNQLLQVSRVALLLLVLPGRRTKGGGRKSI